MYEMKTRIRRGLIFLASVFVFGHTISFAVAASWNQRWDKVVQAAKKEGELRLYSGDDYPELFEEFRRKYPEIKITLVSARGAELVTRVMAERRAGKYLADIVITGPSSLYSLYKAKTLEPIQAAMILPEVTDVTKWWKGGKYNYIDDEGRYIFGFNGEVQPFYGFNTKLVSRAAIKSFWDFLDPKWKGKIGMLEPQGIQLRAIKPALVHLYATPELGPQYLWRLFSEMDILYSRDTRQITDWLSVGKFAISMFTIPNRTGLESAKEQGLPVDWFGSQDLKEGLPLTTASGNVTLMNQAPNPNASIVAINWLLSREGQRNYQKIVKGPDSLRIDIPKNDVPVARRRVEGANYIVTDRPEWMEIQPILDIIKETSKKKG
jgi:ABC-type Fe3+ transport system substrate-binding protein